MSYVKFIIFAIGIIVTTSVLINAHNLRLLEEKDWKGYINIKNNVSGFDESANIQITNNVNGKTEKSDSKDSSSSSNSASSHDTASSASSYETATSASSYDTATSESSYDTATSASSYETATSESSYDTATSASSYDTASSASSYETAISESSYDTATSESSYDTATSASSYETATSASSYETATSASSYETAISESSYDTASSESTVVNEDKKEIDEHKHNLLNSKEINVPTEKSFDNLLKVINGLTIDASKVTSLNINFHYRAPVNSDTKSIFNKLTHLKTLSLNRIKGELSASLVNDIIGNHILESIYIKNVQLTNNSFLETLINSSNETLEVLSITRSELPEDFYKVFGTKSSSFVKLLEVKFAGQKITDSLVKDAFNDKSTIRKYYLPKNNITDIGLISLTKTVLGQFENKVYPWVLVLPYNDIAMKDADLYTQFGLIGEKKEKESSFSVEIYENPLEIVKEKTEKLYKDYGILFNDFDNEGEYDDL